MATLADSLVSSTARKLPLRMRPDLTAHRHRYQGRVGWVIKEPLGLQYTRLHEEEYAILQMLDGESSLDDIKERFEAEFPPQKITLDELQRFIGSLHQSGLLIADVPGQGKQLKKRRDERKWKELLSTLSNILSIRFRGIDPDRLLTWMHPKLKWIYTPWAVAAWFVLGLSAALLVAVEFDVFRSKLPAFHQFFNLHNAFLLAVALMVTKVIHEFGHGLTCKHFGGECHEMGVLVLVLTPCLYCNVSDSWMLPNKWHRAAIGVAGMYVEIAIASVCTFLWWFSEPGLLNNLCLSTMFVCSVSTVMFNANPLLRYDGYYILSDISEIPNLRQKSTDILQRKLREWCLGLESPEDPFLPQRNQMFFALYTVAAAVYRWVVVFSILWFLYKFFQPYRLEIIGQMIGVASLFGLVGQPLWKVGKFFYQPGRTGKVKKPHVYASLGVLAAAAAVVLFVPFPHHVMCPLEIQARDASKVFVVVPGVLAKSDVKPGDRVREGARLALLVNEDLLLKIEELEGQREQYQARLENLDKLKFEDPEAIRHIPETVKSLDSVEKQLAKKRHDLRRLTLTANAGGTVLPPPEKTNKQKDDEDRLPVWTGVPMDPKNLGCYMAERELFCLIGDPNLLQANLVIEQADMEFIRRNPERLPEEERQYVEIMLDELPGDRFEGHIDAVATDKLKVSPQQLSNKSGGELATKTDEAGVERPQTTSYEARVHLPDTEGVLRLGLRGRAKIQTAPQTLARRFWRYVTQTFHFKL